MTCKEKIQRQLKQIKPGDRYYLMICDIDNFKKINDNNGHLFGDAVICTFADELRSLFPSAIKGRIGGDEFAIIMTNCSRKLQQVIYNKISAINQCLQNPGEGLPKVSLSVGVAFSDRGFSEELYSQADKALYKVKENGRCDCGFYDRE